MGYSADSIEANKGDFGESIVYDFIKSSKDDRFKNVSLYNPSGNVAHYCDGIAVAWDTGKVKFMWDVKSKMKLMYFNRTGYDAKNHHLYMKAAKNGDIPFYVFFVDSHPDEERIYFQDVTILDSDRQKFYGGGDDLRTFHLSIMEHARDLTADELKIIIEGDPQNASNLELYEKVKVPRDNHKNYYSIYQPI